MADAPRAILGIDLGTTHTVAAFHEVSGEDASPSLLPIPQPIDAHLRAPRDLLPSVLFAPVEGEAEGQRHPDDPRFLFGEHARRRGAEAPPRLIASAKSWLCNAAVDRDAAMLPWGASDETIARISPIDASALVLRTVATAYLSRGDVAIPRDAAELAQTEVVLTIPASFDDGARELTVLAAERAGLAVTLVEEPTAAFHDWLSRHGREGLVDLLGGSPEVDVLVVDVGGGTTDLSLLRIARGTGPTEAVSVVRVAVSDHLLLGGDNMDLALAHRLEPVFSGLRDERLDPLRFGELCQAVRRAKETLLGDAPPAEAIVTLLGRGSKLLGGAKSAPLTEADVAELLLEGFFPLVTADARPTVARGGLRAAGLPYARDPAISRHLAAFLGRADVRGERSARPLCLLPNGGVFRSRRLVERLVAVVGALVGDAPRVLEDRDTDVAVARGAVASALARRGRGLRIQSGSPRTYFVGVAGADPGDVKLLSVLPRGSEPGERHRVDIPLAVVTGRRVRFDLFTSNERDARPAGEIVTLSPDVHERLPPLTTTLAAREADGGRRGVGIAVPVALEAELTEVGTLSVLCRERDVTDPRAFRLEFQLRGEPSPSMIPPPSVAPSIPPPRSVGPRRATEAHALVEQCFGPAGLRGEKGARDARDLSKQLERVLGERPSWDAALCRGLADALLPFAEARRRSADHERAFFAIAGYALRPGLGSDGDEERVEVLLSAAEDSLAQPVAGRDAKGYQQIFIALRRIAAGLPEATQERIFAWGVPFADGRPRKKGPPTGADDELLSLLAFLHRVPRRARATFAEGLVERTYAGPSPRLWELVARVGARRLAYGSAHLALEAKVVEPWVEDLLRERWEKLATAKKALRELSRQTGERTLDLAPALRARIVKRLLAEGADEAFTAPIERLVDDERADDHELWGESLPPGLALAVTP